MELITCNARILIFSVVANLCDEAAKFIAEEAYEPAYGARPVKRYLKKNVETELASMIIRGEVKDGDKIIIDSCGNKLIYKI